jgi:hypothetical protein
MAWVTPRDWTGITDNIVTAAMLNVDVRDNLTVLSTHTHTGAAGMGSASMSGLTLTSLGVLTFADQSANPDAAGELQRNGAELAWYNGSAVVTLSAADAAAGTASLRTLSTTSTTAAAGNHTHTITQEAESNEDYSDGNTGASCGADSSTFVTIADVAHTCANAANAVIVTGTFNMSGGDATDAFVMRILQGTTALESQSLTIASTVAERQLHVIATLHNPASTSAVTYKAAVAPDNTGANNTIIYATISVTEVTILT